MEADIVGGVFGQLGDVHHEPWLRRRALLTFCLILLISRVNEYLRVNIDKLEHFDECHVFAFIFDGFDLRLDHSDRWEVLLTFQPIFLGQIHVLI